MTFKRLLLSILFVTLAALSTAIAQNSPSRIEAAFQRFWEANSPEAAAQAVPDIEKSGVTFEDADRTMLYGAEVKVRVPNGQ